MAEVPGTTSTCNAIKAQIFEAGIMGEYLHVIRAQHGTWSSQLFVGHLCYTPKYSTPAMPRCTALVGWHQIPMGICSQDGPPSTGLSGKTVMESVNVFPLFTHSKRECLPFTFTGFFTWGYRNSEPTGL